MLSIQDLIRVRDDVKIANVAKRAFGGDWNSVQTILRKIRNSKPLTTDESKAMTRACREAGLVIEHKNKLFTGATMSNGKPDFRWEAGTYDLNGKPYVAMQHNPAGTDEYRFAVLSWTGGIMVFGYVQRFYTGDAYGASTYKTLVWAPVSTQTAQEFATLEEAQESMRAAYDNATASELWEYVESVDAWRFDARYSGVMR